MTKGAKKQRCRGAKPQQREISSNHINGAISVPRSRACGKFASLPSGEYATAILDCSIRPPRDRKRSNDFVILLGAEMPTAHAVCDYQSRAQGPSADSSLAQAGAPDDALMKREVRVAQPQG